MSNTKNKKYIRLLLYKHWHHPGYYVLIYKDISSTLFSFSFLFLSQRRNQSTFFSLALTTLFFILLTTFISSTQSSCLHPHPPFKPLYLILVLYIHHRNSHAHHYICKLIEDSFKFIFRGDIFYIYSCTVTSDTTISLACLCIHACHSYA